MYSIPPGNVLLAKLSIFLKIDRTLEGPTVPRAQFLTWTRIAPILSTVSSSIVCLPLAMGTMRSTPYVPFLQTRAMRR